MFEHLLWESRLTEPHEPEQIGLRRGLRREVEGCRETEPSATPQRTEADSSEHDEAGHMSGGRGTYGNVIDCTFGLGSPLRVYLWTL